MNNGLVLSQRLLTFWQPPANSILLCRSGRTMCPGQALNEALPPTVFPFSGWLGTIFLAIVLPLTPTPRKQSRKRDRGKILKPNSPSFPLVSPSLSSNLSVQDGREEEGGGAGYWTHHQLSSMRQLSSTGAWSHSSAGGTESCSRASNSRLHLILGPGLIMQLMAHWEDIW